MNVISFITNNSFFNIMMNIAAAEMAAEIPQDDEAGSAKSPFSNPLVAPVISSVLGLAAGYGIKSILGGSSSSDELSELDIAILEHKKSDVTALKTISDVANAANEAMTTAQKTYIAAIQAADNDTGKSETETTTAKDAAKKALEDAKKIYHKAIEADFKALDAKNKAPITTLLNAEKEIIMKKIGKVQEEPKKEIFTDIELEALHAAKAEITLTAPADTTTFVKLITDATTNKNDTTKNKALYKAFETLTPADQKAVNSVLKTLTLPSGIGVAKTLKFTPEMFKMFQAVEQEVKKVIIAFNKTTTAVQLETAYNALDENSQNTVMAAVIKHAEEEKQAVESNLATEKKAKADALKQLAEYTVVIKQMQTEFYAKATAFLNRIMVLHTVLVYTGVESVLGEGEDAEKLKAIQDAFKTNCETANDDSKKALIEAIDAFLQEYRAEYNAVYDNAQNIKVCKTAYDAIETFISEIKKQAAEAAKAAAAAAAAAEGEDDKKAAAAKAAAQVFTNAHTFDVKAEAAKGHAAHQAIEATKV